MRLLDILVRPSEELKSRAEKRWRLVVAVSAAPASLAVLLWMFASLSRYPDQFYPYPLNFLLHNGQFLVVSLFFASILLLLLNYLQTGLSRDVYVKRFTRRERDKLAAKRRASWKNTSEASSSAPGHNSAEDSLEALRANPPQQTGGAMPSASEAVERSGTAVEPISAAAVDRLISQVTAGVAERLAARLSELEQRVGITRRVEKLERQSSVTTARTGAAIEAAGWRANVNLILGFAITVSGVSVLVWYVARQPVIPVGDVAHFVGYYAPRLTIVVVVELFAYFFLQLYRRGLEDIKYYNNELTNVESQLRALAMAMDVEDKVAQTDILKSLASIDRNRPAASPTTNDTAKTSLAAATDIVREVRKIASGAGKEGS